MLLRLRQTVSDADYPTGRILERGHTYRFPFTFIVPDRLPPQVCKHAKASDDFEHAHTLLPPSLGDPMIASNGGSLLDDMCSEMCQISYMIRVDVLKSQAADKTPTPMASVAKKVRIIPAVEEAPPLDVSDHNGVYWDRREKDVRRGLMRAKFGRITAEALQPKPVYLFPPTCDTRDSVGTFATVQLLFYPVGDEQPPRLSTLSSKLRVSTFYADHAMDGLPSQTVNNIQPGRAAYVEHVPLSTLCIASASWTEHTETRRSSVESRASCQSSTLSTLGTGTTYYTSSIIVPVNLPKGKAFVPTFDSCLVSRSYALDLNLSYRTPNPNIVNPSIALRIPIQVACQQKVGNGTYPPPPDDIKEEVDEIFRPRRIAPPCPEYTERAQSPEDTL